MTSIDVADIQLLAEAIKGATAPTASVNAASIKLPEFWTEDPELWFARVEAQFSTRDIKNGDTKFNYVVAALDNATAAEVKSILLNPPAADKYEALRDALMEAFAKSQAQKDAELLGISGLGDRRPTALLRKIQSLNSDPDTLLRAFFLAQLPADVRAVLAAMGSMDIEDLAKAADRIIESKSLASHYVNEIEVQEVSAFRSRGTKQQPGSNSPSPSICFFHNKFGTKARRCRPGCLFAELCPPSSTPSKYASPLPRSGNDSAGR